MGSKEARLVLIRSCMSTVKEDKSSKGKVSGRAQPNTCNPCRDARAGKWRDGKARADFDLRSDNVNATVHTIHGIS